MINDILLTVLYKDETMGAMKCSRFNIHQGEVKKQALHENREEGLLRLEELPERLNIPSIKVTSAQPGPPHFHRMFPSVEKLQVSVVKCFSLSSKRLPFAEQQAAVLLWRQCGLCLRCHVVSSTPCALRHGGRDGTSWPVEPQQWYRGQSGILGGQIAHLFFLENISCTTHYMSIWFPRSCTWSTTVSWAWRKYDVFLLGSLGPGLRGSDQWRECLPAQVPTASVTIEGTSALNRVRWASGGREIAVGDSEGRVWIYDVGEVTLFFL